MLRDAVPSTPVHAAPAMDTPPTKAPRLGIPIKARPTEPAPDMQALVAKAHCGRDGDRAHADSADAVAAAPTEAGSADVVAAAPTEAGSADVVAAAPTEAGLEFIAAVAAAGSSVTQWRQYYVDDIAAQTDFATSMIDAATQTDAAAQIDAASQTAGWVAVPPGKSVEAQVAGSVKFKSVPAQMAEAEFLGD